MKGVIYVRVSDQSQVDGTSLDTQEQICRDYAAKEGIKVVRIFREEGVSAKTLDRPQFQLMMEYLSTEKVQALITYKTDRLSRNLSNQLLVINDLREHGVEYHSATENVNNTPAGSLQRNILGAFSEYDNQIRAERCRGGLVARFKEGHWVSAPPPGYTMINKRAVPNDMAEHIKWAYEKRALGWKLEKICMGMNIRGYRGRGGHKIRIQTLDRILKNPFYMGLMRSFDLEVWGKHEPLIDKSLWYKVQVEPKQMIRRVFNPTFPLRGSLYCTECGERLMGSSSTGRSKKYAYYHHRHPSTCPKAKNESKDKVENEFKTLLKKLKPKPYLFPVVKAMLLEKWQELMGKNTNELSKVNRQVDLTRQEKQNLLTEKRRNPNLYSDEDFMEQMNELNKKLKSLEQVQQGTRTDEERFEEAVGIAFDLLKNPVKSWEQIADESKVRFDEIMFPRGVEYDGENCRTPEISLLMNLLGAVSTETEKAENKYPTLSREWELCRTSLQSLFGEIFELAAIR